MHQKALINPRVWAIITMLCPVLLLLMLFIVAPFVPNFDPVRSLISVLSLGQFGWLGVTFFILSAITVLAFARGISGSIPLNKKSKNALTLLYSTAVCLLLLIFIDIDHVHGIWTLKRVVHWAIASAAIGFFSVSCFLIMDNLKEDAAWQGMYVFTIVMAVLTIAIGAGLAFAVRSGLTGLLERLILASAVIWVEVMSVRIYQLSRRDEAGRR